MKTNKRSICFSFIIDKGIMLGESYIPPTSSEYVN